MDKILIVEDETIVALEIKTVLNKLGYKVTSCVTNYSDTMNSIKNQKPDIILMDIHLEDSIDGIDTASEIIKKYNIPIIYLTAFSDDETIKRAIKTNPVGYLIKPFKREELKSTILLAKHKLSQTNELKNNDNYVDLGYNFFYDILNENLYYNNIPIKLGQKENNLLKFLIEAKGQLVSFREIENHIWPDKAISKSSLRTLIYRLRTKLEYKLIETVPSFGCKLDIHN